MNIKEFGDYLRRLREFKGLSTRALAELSGVSQSYISHVESARKQNVPSPDILKKLAEHLGVSYADLMVKAGHVSYEDWFYDRVDLNDKEKYGDLFFSEMLGFPTREAYLEAILHERDEITHTINVEHLKYNGHPLTAQDRKRILTMLEVLFPEYQQPPAIEHKVD